MPATMRHGRQYQRQLDLAFAWDVGSATTALPAERLATLLTDAVRQHMGLAVG